jgi:hypothetical protein
MDRIKCSNCGAESFAGPGTVLHCETCFNRLAEQNAQLRGSLKWALTWLDLEYDRNHRHIQPEWADAYDLARSLSDG